MIKNIVTIFFMAGLIVSCGGDDYYNIATYIAKQSDYEKAIEYISKTIEQNPYDVEAYYREADSQQTLGGNLKQVISDCSKSLESNLREPETYRKPFSVNPKKQ